MSQLQPVIVNADGTRVFACVPVAVLAFLVNQREELLLLAHPGRGGAWEVPSGALEAGETVLDGVLREVREELGPQVRARPLGTVHASTFTYDAQVRTMVSVCYLLAYEGGEIRAGDDMRGAEVRWWGLDELANAAVRIVAPLDQKWLASRAIELYRLWKDQQPPLQVPLSMPPPRGNTRVERMQALVDAWEAQGDRRAIFLNCYLMMTHNTLDALREGRFHDPVWMLGLLNHFADYYFHALDAYEHGDADAPEPWRIAFESRDRGLMAEQHLLLGVNAHINHDLVFAVGDLLRQEWGALAPDDLRRRHEDFVTVNTIIGDTTNAVQATILSKYNPLAELIDRVMGPVDEFLISRLITAWRDQVWANAMDWLMAPDDETRASVRERVNASSREIAGMLMTGRGV